jgi:hypothetical protein
MVTHHRWEERSYESLPQWVKKQWKEGENIKSFPSKGLLRGKSFFYIKQSLEICQDYSTPNGGTGQSIVGYKNIFHRKLRYHSRRRCKYFENIVMDFGIETEVECTNAGCELEEYYEIRKVDAKRNQNWLNKLAFNLNHPKGKVYPRHCNNWCPSYAP